MAVDQEYGPILNLADWLEDQVGITATLVYVGNSQDPNAGGAGATTMSFTPYGSMPRMDKMHATQLFQLVARGVDARTWASEAYGILVGLETTIDGVAMIVTPLQSDATYLNDEDDGGTKWTQNYRLEYLRE